jgi:small GTP-binding protein
MARSVSAASPGLGDVLTPEQQELLADEQALLAEVAEALASAGAEASERDALARSIAQLQDLFLLVVVGEFNAGKSAFINALLGQKVAEEGVTPTTARIGVIRHGETLSRKAEAGADLVSAPVPLLRRVAIVDTPGTNAVLREHEALTRDFVPRADLVLFVTSADRPFSESERSFLEAIRAWGKKVVIVLNKADLLETPGERAEVERFVREGAERLLGFAPEIFPVSARRAAKAKEASDAALLEASGLPALEAFVARTLDQTERIRLKLLNPLGVARRLLELTHQTAAERLAELREDVEAVATLDGQLGLFAEDMRRDFRLRIADVDNVLHEFERRGLGFFESTLRLGRVFDLLNESRIRREFERDVVGDMPRELDRRASDLIDWMVGQEFKQWRAVSDLLGRRQSRYEEEMVGRVEPGTPLDERARLLDVVRRAAQRAVESFDAERESLQLAESVRTAVASTAFVQVGALGLGAVLTIAATTSMADVTGILAAGTLSALGLLILPARRRRAEGELREKTERMRRDLRETLAATFDRELQRMVARIQEAVAPYTRYVRAERDRLDGLVSRFGELRSRADALRARVEALR